MGRGERETPDAEITSARRQFPGTRDRAYLNTAAVGLASAALAETYQRVVDRWVADRFDYHRGERAADEVRARVAGLIGADAADVALIASVSAAAGFVASQLPPGGGGANVVIGAEEYSSNNFPWRQLAARGYDVRQVPFRGGGLQPDDVAEHVDAGTRLVAFSGVQSATGHRSEVAEISARAREVDALVFVDGSQLVGALESSDVLPHVDVLAVPDHKFLLHAARGVGYCYLSPVVQDRFTPVNAGWRAARDKWGSFYGPDMELSPTASRFDNAISWIAAMAQRAALEPFATYGPERIHARNRQLAELLRSALDDTRWRPVQLPERNRSTIVSVPLGGREPEQVVAGLAERGVVASARSGNLRLSLHFYNDEDDVDRVTDALEALGHG